MKSECRADRDSGRRVIIGEDRHGNTVYRYAHDPSTDIDLVLDDEDAAAIDANIKGAVGDQTVQLELDS